MSVDKCTEGQLEELQSSHTLVYVWVSIPEYVTFSSAAPRTTTFRSTVLFSCFTTEG